jgi:methylenetetrahydrofolate dehydrogenase (NADP+)/methenyltetrahydrofolate cyclohydrolase
MTVTMLLVNTISSAERSCAGRPNAIPGAVGAALID